jgi:hypothetical protein
VHVYTYCLLLLLLWVFFFFFLFFSFWFPVDSTMLDIKKHLQITRIYYTYVLYLLLLVCVRVCVCVCVSRGGFIRSHSIIISCPSSFSSSFWIFCASLQRWPIQDPRWYQHWYLIPFLVLQYAFAFSVAVILWLPLR